MIRIVLPVIFMMAFLPSCQKTSSKLETALRMAGENRPELEKVIHHYKAHPQDSLKLKAAVFLIENMPGHKSYEEETINNYFREAYEIIRRNTTPMEKRDQLTELSAAYGEIPEIEDAQIIKSGFLIENIEAAFNSWQLPWATHLNFQQFCEYLLPYKCLDFQALDNWRNYFGSKFGEMYRNMPRNDEMKSSVHQRAVWITQRTRGRIKTYGTWQFNGYPLLKSDLLYHLPFGRCKDYSALMTIILRSHGIATSLEYTPLWGRSGSGHDWHSVLSNNGNRLLAPWNLTSDPGKPFFPNRVVPKVFRETYSPDPKVEEYLSTARHILPDIRLFRRDATSEYLATNNISMKIQTGKLADKKYVYLAAFAKDNWLPVDFGIQKSGKAQFTDAGRNMVYLVMGYDGQSLIPVSNPFKLTSSGVLEIIKPNFQQKISISLKRKYPKAYQTAIEESKLIKGEIHASNDRNFSNYELIHTFTLQNYDEPPAKTNTDQKYRYWRYYAGNASVCSVAELIFLKSGHPLTGEIISSENSASDKEKENILKAFDNDWLTYCSGKRHIWLGYDFGEPVSIDEIACIPRSDDNSIHLGDTYELLYWDKDQWNLLQRQQATEFVLHFDQVPSGALLLLRNVSRGRQERIFTYENGQQIWW